MHIIHQTANTFKIQDHSMSAISYIKRKLIFFVFIVYNIFETLPSSIIIKNNSGEVLKFHNEYYYCSGNKIINCADSSVLFDGENQLNATASDKYLYVLDGAKIYKITSEGTIIAKKNLETSLLDKRGSQIYYYDDIVCVTVDKDYVFDGDLNFVSIDELKSESDHHRVESTDYYIVEKDTSFLIIAEYDDNSSFISLINKSDGSEIFSTARTVSIYDNCLFLYYCNSRHVKYDLNSRSIVSSFENTNGVSFFSAKIKKDCVISLGMKTNRGDIEYSDKMRDHFTDIIEITDTSGKLITTHKTQRHERIVFFNNEKAVTYYKGEYRFYNLNEWTCYKTIYAENISSNGTYSYESCGDYIFVFDSSNNLIDRISIDEDV